MHRSSPLAVIRFTLGFAVRFALPVGVRFALPVGVRFALPVGVLAALALGAGCSPGPIVRDGPADPVAGYPDHTAEQIEALVAASVARVRAYTAESRLQVESRDRDFDATAGLRARIGDSLLAVVRGPLGVEGGRALVTADSFFALDRLHGRLYVGALAAAERYVPGAGAEGRLARALLGLEAPPVGAGWSVRAAGGLYVLVAPGTAQTWTVDPRLWRVTAVVERAADGRRLSRTYGDFEAVGGVPVPRRVVLASPDDRASLTLEHRSVAVNPSGLRFSFAPPRDAEVVRVGTR